MKDIRPIRRREADEFLRLLCVVFGLDYSQAKSIFFSEPGYDLSRKWGLFLGGELISILTTTPLKFGWGCGVGIAGVATRDAWRGRGLAEDLLNTVLEHGRLAGEAPAMLFARDARLYERLGFAVTDIVIKGEVVSEGIVPESTVMPLAEVQAAYSAWSAADPARLVRDGRRWELWTWSMKHCEPRQGGYVCVEPALLREAILPPGLEKWPVHPGTVYFGTESLAQVMGVPLTHRRQDLLVMTRGFPSQPQMFMTDQF